MTWEYRVITVSTTALERDLNAMGKNGWEAVSVFRSDLPGAPAQFALPVLYATVVLKRPVADP